MTVAAAEDYPSKPITVMVPFAAGGSTDLMARAAAQGMTTFFKQNIVVNNRGGGAGTIGLASLARQRPDGYTVGIVPAAPLVNQPHMRRTPYGLDSFDYICQLFFSPQVLAVKPGSPFKDLKQLVAYAKSHPNELSYGSPGPGTLPNVAMEQFLKKAGIKIKHVPFTGSAPAATALQGGHIDMQVTIANVAVDRGFPTVAVFSKEPLESLPNVKTAIAQGYDMTASWWGGMIAPKGLPENVKNRLTQGCESTTQSDSYTKTLHNLGSMSKYRDSKDFEQYVRDVSKTNKKLIDSVFK
ncbi:tripartite tricarboxylate transporter substrate binding protein [Salinisphaera aquimarina]|uniref:Tripartite tricarboxylate transporter substrate binding protein n=1 Tax=Salinisphaera aquimarina TaxID=2094031 RepID=A0ABV7ETD3_9GAMM